MAPFCLPEDTTQRWVRCPRCLRKVVFQLNDCRAFNREEDEQALGDFGRYEGFYVLCPHPSGCQTNNIQTKIDLGTDPTKHEEYREPQPFISGGFGATNPTNNNPPFGTMTSGVGGPRCGRCNAHVFACTCGSQRATVLGAFGSSGFGSGGFGSGNSTAVGSVGTNSSGGFGPSPSSAFGSGFSRVSTTVAGPFSGFGTTH